MPTITEERTIVERSLGGVVCHQVARDVTVALNAAGVDAEAVTGTYLWILPDRTYQVCHSWVILPSLGLYVDGTHGQFRGVRIRSGKLTDVDYQQDYRGAKPLL